MARLATLFDRALALPRVERDAFVTAACGNDTALREELGSLLAADESAAEYFSEMAAQIVAPAYDGMLGAPDAASQSDLLQRLQSALSDSYRIERELGGGAMSRVFQAEELKLGRKVVIKVLPPEMAADVSTERFRREIQVAAQLQHPHVVPVLTSGLVDSVAYYTMPFVAGESLRHHLAREGPLAAHEATIIWRDVLDALAHAHANGVIHRDIKPGNILLTGRHALVTDFGIARAMEVAAGDSMRTGTGLTIGTPAYMAPEQALGSVDADHRVDIYAAALVMHEMLEGRPPSSGNSARQRMLARLTSDPAPLNVPGCPPVLVALVRQCLATDPRDRPQSAEAVLTALDAISSAPRRRVPWRSAGLAALVLVAVALAATRLGRTGDGASRPAVAASPSIAVLPLANLSADPRDGALADGMTEQLIGALGRTGNMRVIGSTSVLALKDRRMSLRDIADTLRVSYVLEGGFQKVDTRMRIQLRLLDARDGSTRWTETYDRRMDDILAVQDDISRAVARELDLRLAGGGRTRPPSSRRTPNMAAYEWYLRGMDVALMRTDTGRRLGQAYFQRAIAIDSNYAAAYAGLVRVLLTGSNNREAAQAERAALKAVALDDSLPEARAALGWSHLAHDRYETAEAEFRRAVALDQNVSRGYEGLARVYMMLGRPAEQLAAARIGLEIDPFSHSAIRELALALSVNGRCDEAIKRLRPLKTLSPPANVAGVIIGMCQIQREQWPDAIAELRWAEKRKSAAAPALLGYALARSGRRDEARGILADIMAGRTSSNDAYGIAVVYAGLRDYDQAFVWLDKAVQERSFRPYIMDPMFTELHRDPRFALLRSRLELQKR